MVGTVVAEAKALGHRFSKNPALEIAVVEWLRMAGDAHYGAAVKHRSRVASDPAQPSLCQVPLNHICTIPYPTASITGSQAVGIWSTRPM